MAFRVYVVVALTVIGTACAPAAAPPSPTAAPTQTFSPAVQALIQGAQHETVLKGSWSPTSFGGSAGFERLIQGMNRKYGLHIQAQFTPGIDEQAMAGRLAQEAAANQPATEDVYLGNPAGVHDVIPTHVFKSVDWRAVVDRPIDPEGEFDPVAPDGVAVAFASSVVGITYNTNLVKPTDVPHRLNDLLDPKWKGKIASTPYASGCREFVAPDLLGSDATLSFVRKFAPQVAGLIRRGEDDRITSGEFLMLVMDCGANQVMGLKRQGAPIDHALLANLELWVGGACGPPAPAAAPLASSLRVFIHLPAPTPRMKGASRGP